MDKVYGANAMSEGKVRKRVIDFKDGSNNVHDEASSGRLTLISDDLVA